MSAGEYLSHPDISAKFAGNIKPRRGRPKSLRRQAVRAVEPEPLSERSIGNKVAAMRVAEAIGKVDSGLYEWLYRRRVTVVYALGRLPLYAIPQIAQELRDEGPISAREAVQLIRVIRHSLIAEAREAAAVRQLSGLCSGRDEDPVVEPETNGKNTAAAKRPAGGAP